MLRECKVCGLEAHIEEELELFVKNTGAKYNRKNICKVCDTDRQRNKNLKVKMECLEYKGNCCAACDIKATEYNSVIFDFHHIDRATKDFDIAKKRFSFDIVKEELDKCILLCSNCHRLEHKYND